MDKDDVPLDPRPMHWLGIEARKSQMLESLIDFIGDNGRGPTKKDGVIEHGRAGLDESDLYYSLYHRTKWRSAIDAAIKGSLYGFGSVENEDDIVRVVVQHEPDIVHFLNDDVMKRIFSRDQAQDCDDESSVVTPGSVISSHANGAISGKAPANDDAQVDIGGRKFTPAQIRAMLG